MIYSPRSPLLFSSLLLITLLSGGCSIAPTVEVVLVDRHTVMESEAAGEWPQIEQRLRHDLHTGPVPLSQIDTSGRQQRAFRVLNGEYPATAASDSPSAGE
ncbi:hypothetical protein D5085_06810 [Ectothiorhodospiraceae bacterium BW-2]|nr:hypothetical protein D5085_06810 [Ectothiorhodospiraceae bacterium BW-2]